MIVTFNYTNWRGEHSARRVKFLGVEFGVSEYHVKPQFLMHAFDLDKGVYRLFAMADMSDVTPAGALLTLKD